MVIGNEINNLTLDGIVATDIQFNESHQLADILNFGPGAKGDQGIQGIAGADGDMGSQGLPGDLKCVARTGGIDNISV